MSLSSVLLPLLALSLTAGAPQKHPGMSAQDAFLSCAGAILGKPVMADRLEPSRLPPCPSSRDALVKGLRELNLQVLDAGRWMYLAPIRFYTNGLQYELPRWKRLLIRPHTELWTVPDSRPLSADERASIALSILEQSRSVPISLTPELDQGIPGEHPPRPDDDTTVREVFVTLDAHRLAAAAPESIVAVVTGGEFGAYSRVVYGELREGRFELLWDSPLFWGWRLGIGYSDVDGDGFEELLLWSKYGSARSPVGMLSILTRQGTELTRQRSCIPPDDEGFWERDASLCPIVADSIELVAGAAGKKDIVAHRTFGGLRQQRFRLTHDLYEPTRSESGH